MTGERPSWRKRIGWFILIWAASVAALTIVAWLIRMVLL